MILEAKVKRLGGLVLLALLAFPLAALENENDASALATMLAASANYCEKLKAAAFSYFCLEQVSETLADPSGHRQKNVFHYDYQIVGKNGKASEQRTLVSKNGKEKRQENARLSTRIFSYYSFYLPVFLLARENQGKYEYHLQAAETIEGINAQAIKVVLKELAGGPVVDGQVWLDTSDSSVIKIDLNPRYFAGFAQLQQEAAKNGAELLLSDVHWYEVKKNGLRFPSKTEIKETYRLSGTPPGSGRSSTGGLKGIVDMNGAGGDWNSAAQRWEFDRSRTVFSYSRHRFFYVEMEYNAQPLEK